MMNIDYSRNVEQPLIELLEKLVKQIEYLQAIDILEMEESKAKNIINKINSLQSQYKTIADSLDNAETFISQINLEIDKAEKKSKLNLKIAGIWERINDLHRFKLNHNKLLNL